MSRPVATGRGASDMTATPQCDESESHPSASQAHHPTPRSDRALWQQILRIPSRFFSVSIFAARIPLVSADAGDDFSNNLLSDLAPIMALFGEKVAIQYMSQSMDWVEDLIFATAPLGIITAIVGAIRVGGPTWMKAVIGRAREGKGVVEVELMSSTSSDVCELWNGDGVVRVMGSSPIIELLYVEVPSVNPLHIDPPEEFQDSDSLDGWQEDNDQDHLLEVHHPTGIYDFKSAKDTILQNESLKEAQESDNSDAPNIALNIGGERVSDPELNIVAIIGIWLQLGVIVFAGFSVLYSPWAGKFQKNDKNVQLYAFPAMAAGTVALVVGMFICARIIERSTSETKWVIKRRYHNVKVAWVQKSGVVNDQQFNSYFIRRSSEVPKSLTRWLRTDTQPQIMTSRKREGLQQTSLTTAATFLSLLGFAAQFVGLRGMNWSVTIAQLMAVAIMTVLRALVRRNLVSNVQQQPIETGYELDFVAAQIKNCSHWNAVTWGVDRSEDFRSNGLASKVLDARCRLGELSKWECQWQKTVDSTIEAIEATINFLSTHSDVTLSGLYSLFEWELVIEVSTAQGNRVFETVQLSMAREWLSEGRGWGYWKVDKSRIEAILGLWMSHIKHSEGRKSSLVHRIVDVDKETYEQWVRRQEQTTTKIHCGELIIGKPSTALPSRDGHFHMLAVLSGAPLDSICGQAILSAFISKVAETVLGEIGGRVGVRGGTGVKASFGLRNQVLDELANKVEQTGLASIEDAFLSIIPPLQKAGKLSTITLTTVETSLNLTKEINLYIEGGRFDQAEPLLLWLLDVAETSANSHKTEKRWGEAWGVYLALLDTYSGIKGGEDYRNKAEETMGLFCEMMFMSFEWTSDRSLRDLVSDALGGQRQELWESSLQQWEFKLQNWGKDKINLPTTDQILAERLLQASTDGNCLDVARLSTQISDLNTQDSLEICKPPYSGLRWQNSHASRFDERPYIDHSCVVASRLFRQEHRQQEH
ncbi:hypothetical protein BDD12DRAFT_468216 [Trichophaea hybrida]|nr:hypothetical protein BDD12DRAFT_468216 [Trichophaea hybrida]